MNRIIDMIRREGLIEIARLATWKYRQPLTQRPDIPGAIVSDLFFWRNSLKWETFFEIVDLPALFNDEENTAGSVSLYFFDASGELFLKKEVQILANCRNTLALSEIIGKMHGEFGTFCVFHSSTPHNISSIGANLSERGYLSYRYRNNPLRSFVHGNLDAIALLPNQTLQLLGGSSLLSRKYNLQHAMSCCRGYELGFVNPTAKKQKILCSMLSDKGDVLSTEVVNLSPRGCHFFKVKPDNMQQRIVISSRLIMARPLAFQLWDQSIDVFHG
jgi:hypothetical protein